MSKDFRNFSVIARRQCCVVKLSRIPHCHFESIMIEIFIHLIVETTFIYLRQIRQEAYWTIIFNIVPVFLLKTEITSAFLNSGWKVTSNIELVKLLKINSEKYRCCFYFHRYTTFLTSFFYVDYGSLLKYYFFVSRLNKNFR